MRKKEMRRIINELITTRIDECEKRIKELESTVDRLKKSL